MTEPTPTAVTSVGPAIPSFTGNPVLDNALRSLIMIASGSLSAALVSYLSKKGITDVFVTNQIPALVGAVLSALVAIAVAVWSAKVKNATVNAVVDNAIIAASTGQIPDAVKALASNVQKEAITLAEK